MTTLAKIVGNLRNGLGIDNAIYGASPVLYHLLTLACFVAAGAGLGLFVLAFYGLL